MLDNGDNIASAGGVSSRRCGVIALICFAAGLLVGGLLGVGVMSWQVRYANKQRQMILLQLNDVAGKREALGKRLAELEAERAGR